MPIVKYNELRTLIENGNITAITLDTTIFEQKNLQLDSASFQVLARLSNRGFCFLLTKIVCNEVICHLEDASSEALNSAKKGIGLAVRVFGTKKPTRKKLLDKITGGISPRENALKFFFEYMQDSNCKILDDGRLVDTRILFRDYFAKQAPFGIGKKKSEFPDALALNALERTAIDDKVNILVVSKDNGWKEFCEQSKCLYYIPDLNQSLSLIANASPVLIKSILKCLKEDDSQDNSDIRSYVADQLESADITISGNASSRQCEFYISAIEFKSIIWPEEKDIDIIELEHEEEEEENEDYHHLVLNLPLELQANLSVDVSFIVWDSVDGELASTGNRTIELEKKIGAHADIIFKIYELGTVNENIIYDDMYIFINSTEIDLGDIDVLEDFEIKEL